MADSTSAQQDIIKSRAAAKQARAIFYKIETLVYEAVRTEIDEEINQEIKSAIDAHLAKEAPSEAKEETESAHSAEFAAIRHLISFYVQEVIEQEAPAIITKTLAKALRPPSDHKGAG